MAAESTAAVPGCCGGSGGAGPRADACGVPPGDAAVAALSPRVIGPMPPPATTPAPLRSSLGTTGGVAEVGVP